jgi:hypothetical protein
MPKPAHPIPDFSPINLLLAPLLRWQRLWPADTAPPSRFVGCLARTQDALAAAIRATLAADGRACPKLGDAELTAWFNQNRPGSDQTARSVRPTQRVGDAPRHPPADAAAAQPRAPPPHSLRGANLAALHQARAPP